MIKFYTGNLLDSGANILCHQTNVHGVMGAGVAYHIARNKLSTDEMNKYRRLCAEKSEQQLLGQVQYLKAKDFENHHQMIANIFSQRSAPNEQGHLTDYSAMYRAMEEVRDFAKTSNLTVAIPAKMGCGIAGGDWNYVLQNVIIPLFSESTVELSIWELPPRR